jgi:hypothetical protein
VRSGPSERLGEKRPERAVDDVSRQGELVEPERASSGVLVDAHRGADQQKRGDDPPLAVAREGSIVRPSGPSALDWQGTDWVRF